MIFLITLSLFCALGSGEFESSKDPEYRNRVYDLRWFQALASNSPYVDDLYRRGYVDLTNDWGGQDYPLHVCDITEDSFGSWIRQRHPELRWWWANDSESTFVIVRATEEGHRELATELRALRASLRSPVRVRWMRVAEGVDTDRWPVVLTPESVESFLREVPITELLTGMTSPGRGSNERTREHAAALTDLDVEGQLNPIALDPQVVVQRSGAELFVLPYLEADGSWDLRAFVQDAEALPSRCATFPTGREPLELLGSSWLSYATSARVPNGGGLLIEAQRGRESAKWLITVEGKQPSQSYSSRFYPLGRLARVSLERTADHVQVPSPSGGYYWTDAESWPLVSSRDLPGGFRARATEIIDGSWADVVQEAGIVVSTFADLGTDAAWREQVTAQLDALSRIFPTYQVELRARREPAVQHAFDAPPRATSESFVRSAVRAGDTLTTALLSESSYLYDADVEISGGMSGPDLQIKALSTGMNSFVRCNPTRSGKIEVTCEWQEVESVRPLISIEVPIANEGPLADRTSPSGKFSLERTTETFQLECPQQSNARLRSKFLAEPGQWSLVGSTPIALTADQLTVWVKVTPVVD